MTERLYYRDSNLLRFEAAVTAVGVEDGRPYAVLDRSAFYPTSGGQLHDLGRLNGVEVVEVGEIEGDIRHYLAASIGDAGTAVAGEIDSDRRRRHCRQHTAQHLLSAVLFDQFGYQTVSVHLGEEYGAVEVNVAEVSSERISIVETICRTAVADNLQVETVLLDRAEAEKLPLRKPLTRAGEVRLVRVGDLDWSACGGTHCSGTAELGLFKIVGVDKLRGHALIRFLVGRQAETDYDLRFAACSELSHALTCSVSELPAKAAAMTAEILEIKHRMSALYSEVLPVRARAMAEETVGGPVAVTKCDLPDMRLTGQLAKTLADLIERPAAVFCEGRLALATPETSALDAGALARRLCEATGLRGGGGKHLAQLGVADENLLDEYRSALEKLLCEE